MPYRRWMLMTACLFLSASIDAQQYPFVHYTPKDGLISNRVRNICQDSKGRLYFSTTNGLSVYDGVRFTNYTSEEGLHNDVVNYVMEMGDDSLWVLSNTNHINCLVRGVLKDLSIADPTTPIINFLCRNANGVLYAAADDGLFSFDKGRFTKLALYDLSGKDIGNYLYKLVPLEKYMLVVRDYTMNQMDHRLLYLYDYNSRKIVAQSPDGITIFSADRSKDGRVWVGTNKGIRQLNPLALSQGKIVAEDLPPPYKNFNGRLGYVFFGNDNNCWLSDGMGSLNKTDTSGRIDTFTTGSGLNSSSVSFIFQDKENNIWLATNGSGVEKLMHNNISVTEKPFGLLSVSSIVANGPGELLLFSPPEKKLVRFTNGLSDVIRLNSEEIGSLLSSRAGLYGISAKKIFQIFSKTGYAETRLLYADTTMNSFGNSMIDKNGNIIIAGDNYLTAVAGTNVSRSRIGTMADQVSMDTKGDIWVATRSERLYQFRTDPQSPTSYLKQEALFEKELKGISPRSLAIDKTDMVWIGTRYKGIYVFRKEAKKLVLVYHLSAKTGLTENFISYLVADKKNNVWAASPSGVDKIHIDSMGPVIENITRQNNMYQYINSITVDENNTAWVLSDAGLIRITDSPENPTTYLPKLMLTQIRSGSVSFDVSTAASFSYGQNDLIFNFAATTFLDEKRVKYSYRLQGRSNTDWTETGNNATASFIDLRPGHYILMVQASFPAARYPDQILQYKFSIAPPWWQTWWFKLSSASLILGLLVLGFRSYYRGKLNKQRTLLENQQALEKERTRIATDMHDDLGAGLSKIRFLSETVQRNITDEKNQPHLENISSSSVELVDKFNEIIWAMNEKNNSLEDLLYYIRNYSAKYCAENNIDYKIIVPEDIPAINISGEIRRHIFLAIKESLHNVIKHAGAKNVFIDIKVNNEIIITIQDDGKGFDKTERQQIGNGLRSMEQRMKSVNGSLRIENKSGSVVTFIIPLQGS